MPASDGVPCGPLGLLRVGPAMVGWPPAEGPCRCARELVGLGSSSPAMPVTNVTDARALQERRAAQRRFAKLKIMSPPSTVIAKENEMGTSHLPYLEDIVTIRGTPGSVYSRLQQAFLGES